MSDNSSALNSALERRVELKEAVSALEVAVSAAAADPDWWVNVQAAIAQLTDAWQDHIHEVERPDGLLAEIQATAPRLHHAIHLVEAEHPAVLRRLALLAERASDSSDHGAVRDEVLTILFDIVRHRQKGADLTYEAYFVDIGGG